MGYSIFVGEIGLKCRGSLTAGGFRAYGMAAYSGGEMAERLNAAVLKTVEGIIVLPGFESLSLRHMQGIYIITNAYVSLA